MDAPLGNRYGRWWAAYGSGGSVYLPLSMLNSGHWFTAYLSSNVHDVFQSAINTELARPAQADLMATRQRIGNHLRLVVRLTNLSGVTLSSNNAAAVAAIVYEEHTPIDVNTDHITHRIVRAAVYINLSTPLAHGATTTITLETTDLTNVVDWSKVRAVALADYRPGGTSGPYDMLQAADAAMKTFIPLARRAP